jgi:hypothetical protein
VVFDFLEFEEASSTSAGRQNPSVLPLREPRRGGARHFKREKGRLQDLLGENLFEKRKCLERNGMEWK